MEKTLIILKPDAVKRKLIGKIISRFENKNFNIEEIKFCIIKKELVEIHYSHVKELSIYEDMLNYMISGPSMIMIIEGENVIQTIRNMIGKTKSSESNPGTIRGDYGSHKFENLIHASDSVESANIEIKRFFG